MTLPDLLPLRQAIDEVDHKILDLIAERLKVVLQVGDIKRAHGVAVYDPDRERRVLERLAEHAPPPLDGQTARRVFERIIDESRRLEQRHVREVETTTEADQKAAGVKPADEAR